MVKSSGRLTVVFVAGCARWTRWVEVGGESVMERGADVAGCGGGVGGRGVMRGVVDD